MHDQPRQHVKKQRYYFANKGLYSQSYDFSRSHAWMWELDHKEDWAQKNGCFQIMVPVKTLESPLDFKEINQSILNKINPEYSLEGLMLKLKLQYFDHLMRRTDSLEKSLMLGKIEGGRRRGWQRMRRLDGITNSIYIEVWISSRSWWWRGKPGVLQSMGLQRVGHEWVTELKWLCIDI